jgi:hypothetical protein
MRKADEYLERASAAEINAAHAHSAKARRELLSLAAAWRDLAEVRRRSRARVGKLASDVAKQARAAARARES